MEVAAAKTFFDATFGFLTSEIGRRYELWKGVEGECESLKTTVVLFASKMDDELHNCRDDHLRTAALRTTFTKLMRELAHDIEHCIERFEHRVTCKEGASWAYRVFHSVKMYRTRHKFATKMKQLRKRSEETIEHIKAFNPRAGGGGAATTSRAESDCPDNPVGIAEAKKELLELLVEPIQAMVIAVVGFGGSGKTTLTRAVYHSVDKVFLCAWVTAHSLDADGILKEIHQQLFPGGEYSATSLKRHLATSVKPSSGAGGDAPETEPRRYLIVIDDITIEHMKSWDTICNTLKGNGTIIVTTTIQSIANTCIRNLRQENICSLGYVYKIRTLGEEDSKKLAFPGRCTPELKHHSVALLKKCDGLPLALASVAKKFSSEDEPTGQSCQKLCYDLGKYVEHEDHEDPYFARLRGVLMDNYSSLSDYTARTCLLYLGIFSVDRPFRRSVIIRRWLAEGYARGRPYDTDTNQTVADKNLKEFIDRNIIQPVGPKSNAIVKICKTWGIMHVFMLHKSMSEKFIMPFGAEHKKVRHLFVHDNNGTNLRKTSSLDLSSVRSLTVLGNAGDAISDFTKYKVMRVLDLEGCTDVNDGHLKKICKLWNLRYLSLGPNVTNLPKDIAQLKLLETLDVSKSNVDVLVLPVEVIGLPCLLNLIGKFTLSDPVGTESSELEEQSKKSKLETLAGFVADKCQGFLELMVHMKYLNKVKIWCDAEGTGQQFDQLLAQLNNHLLEAIKKYTEADPIDKTRSLSIDFRRLAEGSLYALRELYNHSLHSGTKYYLTTLKLRGNSAVLPDFVSLFPFVAELCLSPTNVTRELLIVLSKMQCLLYLKLIFSSIDDFVVTAGDFESLRRLRFVWHGRGLILPTIEDGALPELVSFQLLCSHLVGLSGIKITHLKQLTEIALHPGVALETREQWEEAARMHPKRPNVLPIRRVDYSRNEDPTVAREESATDQADIQMPIVVAGSSVAPDEAALDQNGIQPQIVDEEPSAAPSSSFYAFCSESEAVTGSLELAASAAPAPVPPPTSIAALQHIGINICGDLPPQDITSDILSGTPGA